MCVYSLKFKRKKTISQNIMSTFRIPKVEPNFQNTLGNSKSKAYNLTSNGQSSNACHTGRETSDLEIKKRADIEQTIRAFYAKCRHKNKSSAHFTLTLRQDSELNGKLTLYFDLVFLRLNFRLKLTGLHRFCLLFRVFEKSEHF